MACRRRKNSAPWLILRFWFSYHCRNAHLSGTTWMTITIGINGKPVALDGPKPLLSVLEKQREPPCRPQEAMEELAWIPPKRHNEWRQTQSPSAAARPTWRPNGAFSQARTPCRWPPMPTNSARHAFPMGATVDWGIAPLLPLVKRTGVHLTITAQPGRIIFRGGLLTPRRR